MVVRTIAHGEKVAGIIEEGKYLMLTTGDEHALVSLQTGQRALVSGGPKGITLDELPIRRMIGHTDPYHLAAAGASDLDGAALTACGQRSSYLLEHGELSRFWLGP